NSKGSPVLIAKLVITFESGDPIIFESGEDWRVTDTLEAGWTGLAFECSLWEEAKIVCRYGEKPFGKMIHIPTKFSNLLNEPNPYLRKSFTLDQQIKRAIIFVSALGLYELYVNGKKVGNDFFTPGWT